MEYKQIPPPIDKGKNTISSANVLKQYNLLLQVNVHVNLKKSRMGYKQTHLPIEKCKNT